MKKTMGGNRELRRARDLLRDARPLGCVSFAKAAVMLSRSESTVREWVRTKKLLTVYVRGERLIPLSEIRRRCMPASGKR